MSRITMLHCPIWEETIDIHRLLFFFCFVFPRTKLVLRRYEMFKPYLVYIDFCLLSPSHSRRCARFRTAGTRDCRRRRCLPVRWEWMWRQRKTNYCKCTHCMLCLIIMCNVAALTFYATIYEDICCICNKSREKHVRGTASSAGSCVYLILSIRTSRPILRSHDLHGTYGLIKIMLTLFSFFFFFVL